MSGPARSLARIASLLYPQRASTLTAIGHLAHDCDEMAALMRGCGVQFIGSEVDMVTHCGQCINDHPPVLCRRCRTRLIKKLHAFLHIQRA